MGGGGGGGGGGGNREYLSFFSFTRIVKGNCVFFFRVGGSGVWGVGVGVSLYFLFHQNRELASSHPRISSRPHVS